MKNKQQALERLSALENESKELREIINASSDNETNQFKRWRVEKGKGYYLLKERGGIGNFKEELDDVDNYLYSIGNYFKTREEVEKHKEKLILQQQIKDRIRDLNEGWTPDWSNDNMVKCSPGLHFVEFNNQKYNTRSSRRKILYLQTKAIV